MGNNTERNNTQASLAEESNLQMLAAALPGDGLPTPGAPGLINIDEVGDNVGPKQGDIGHYGLTDDLTPTLHGNIDGGDGLVMQVYANTEYLGSVMISEGGDWEFTTKQLQAGSKYVFELLLKDPVSSEILVSMPYTIITTEAGMDALNAPEIDGIWDDVGQAQGPVHSGDTTDDARPTIFGKADADSTVVIMNDGQPIGSVTADGKGNWSFTPTADLTDGEYNITAVTQDADGNQSQPSDAIDFTIDTSGLGPIVPDAATDIQLWDDVGTIQDFITNGTVTDDNKPTLSGKATPGDIVYVYDDKAEIGSAKVQTDGSWSFEPGKPLTDGAHSFTTVVKDAQGNQSAASAAINFTVDTVISAPAITGFEDDVGNNTGNVPDGGKTDDTSPVLSGTAEAGSLVTITRTGPNGATYGVGSVHADSSGHWTLETNGALGNKGGYAFHISATDKAGNMANGADYHVTLVDSNQDNVNPTPAELKIVYIEDNYQQHHKLLPDAGSNMWDDGKTWTTFNDLTPTLHGTGEPGSTLSIYNTYQSWTSDKNISGKSAEPTFVGTVHVDENGQWVFTDDFTGKIPSGGSSQINWTIIPQDNDGNLVTDNALHQYLQIRNVADNTSGAVPDNLPKQAAITYIEDNYQQHHKLLPDAGSNMWDDGKTWTTFNDLTPTLHGTGEPGSTLSIYNTYQSWTSDKNISGKSAEPTFVGTVHVDENGQWVFTDDFTGKIPSGGSSQINWTIIPQDNDGNLVTDNALHQYLQIRNTTESVSLQSEMLESHSHAGTADLSSLSTNELLTLEQHSIVDIHSVSIQTLSLTTDDILTHAQQDMFIQDGKQQLAVTGDAGDVVELKLENVAQQWQESGKSTVAGVTYEVYHNEGSTTELLVQQGVELHQS